LIVLQLLDLGALPKLSIENVFPKVIPKKGQCNA
jgi:hypothetical protein